MLQSSLQSSVDSMSNRHRASVVCSNSTTTLGTSVVNDLNRMSLQYSITKYFANNSKPRALDILAYILFCPPLRGH